MTSWLMMIMIKTNVMMMIKGITMTNVMMIMIKTNVMTMMMMMMMMMVMMNDEF